MIDWITAIIPCHGAGRLVGSRILCIDANGEIEWETNRRVSVEGSYSSAVQVKAEGRRRLWVSGNPSKFLQGHNLFGSNGLRKLIVVFMLELADRLGLEPTQEDFDVWLAGRYVLKRVDVAACFRLPSTLQVDNWIRSASPLVRGKHQGVSQYGGETIYVGQRSRRISLKIYNKGREIRKHPPCKSIPYREELFEFSEGLLRAEVTIRAQELKRRNLDKAWRWKPGTGDTILRERIGRLEMPKKLRLTATEIADLPPRLVGAVKLWEAGHDLRSVYPRATFYRYRGELRRYGVDISSPPRTATNVVPLVTYLEAEYEAEVPDWAVGTSLLACS